MKKVILGRIVAILLFAGNGFSPTASSLTGEPVKLEGKWLYNSTTVNGVKVNSAGDPDTDFVQFESDRFTISQNGVEKSGTWWLVDKRLKSMDGWQQRLNCTYWKNRPVGCIDRQGKKRLKRKSLFSFEQMAPSAIQTNSIFQQRKPSPKRIGAHRYMAAISFR